MKNPVLMLFLIAMVATSMIGCGDNKDDTSESSAEIETSSIKAGFYEAILDSPGGDLRFGLSLMQDQVGDAESEWMATLHNGPEQIFVDEVEVTDTEVTLSFPHYDSQIVASVADEVLSGTWRKRSGSDSWTEMDFSAKHVGLAPVDTGTVAEFEPFLGRWKVQFSESDDPAIGVFKADSRRGFVGTFLTTVGDYRYLSGRVVDGTLWMSCFDGAHAFLFRVERDDDGGLVGEFWSRDSWHEQWNAVSDDEAVLADGFSLTTWNEDVALSDLAYPDLAGELTKLDDPEFTGRVRLLHVFGSWCPNCHDAGEFLSELKSEYGSRGLKIQGLAFELTDDAERNAEQVRKYLARHEMDYPVLLVGPSDKMKASNRFPVVDRIRSYPTTIFLDHENRIRFIHTGFSGPATGATHEALKSRFREIIEELLAEASPS